MEEGSWLVRVFIELEGKLERGTFIRRENRFLVLAEMEGSPKRCFLPNPGRLRELLVPGANILLREVRGEGRDTTYDVLAISHEGNVVVIDARVPNKLILKALQEGALDEFEGYGAIHPEHTFGRSRFDFLLSRDGERCLIEVKSCTLVRDGIALFPDAVTERGSRHMLELMDAKREGYRASVIFLVQRTDARYLSPNDETDPKFGRNMREAAKGGVEVYAYSSAFIEGRIELVGMVPVRL